MALLTLTDLAVWAQVDLEDLREDPLASKVIEQASALVCYYGGHEWDMLSPDPGDHPPLLAKIIAEQLALRTYNNPFVLERRAVGPVSETFYQEVLTGMSLNPDEIEKLQKFTSNDDGDVGNRVYTMSMLDSTPPPPRVIPFRDAYKGIRGLLPYDEGYPW